jgi:hypothetical protein
LKLRANWEATKNI